MGVMASPITSLAIVYSTVNSDVDQRKQISASLAQCAGNSSVTGEFPAQMASNAESVSIWWRHHGLRDRYWINECENIHIDNCRWDRFCLHYRSVNINITCINSVCHGSRPYCIHSLESWVRSKAMRDVINMNWLLYSSYDGKYPNSGQKGHEHVLSSYVCVLITRQLSTQVIDGELQTIQRCGNKQCPL